MPRTKKASSKSESSLSSRRKLLEEKFSPFLRWEELERYKPVSNNGEIVFLDGSLKDTHDQEYDIHEKECWNNVAHGTAHKNAKNWSATFRMYNALQYVNKPGMNVLELGCDTAFLRKMIHRGSYVSGTNYVGIDINTAALRTATEQMKRCNNPAVFVQHDLYNGLPIVESDTVDFLVAMEVLEHLEEEPGMQLVDEMYRVLKPGHILYLSMPNHDPSHWYNAKGHKDGYKFHHREYTLEEGLALFRDAGFTIDKYYGWIGDRRRILERMDNQTLMLYNKLCGFMDNQIPTQLFAQLYPDIAGGIIYIMTKV